MKRPNQKKRPPRRSKIPSWNKVWHRRTENVNKEIADDLRGRFTIETGGYLIWVPGNMTVGEKKKRV